MYLCKSNSKLIINEIIKIFTLRLLNCRRIGHFAWFFEQNMPLWVKLRGRFLAVLFGILQTTLYLSIAV